jgi:hypothetical protein
MEKMSNHEKTTLVEGLFGNYTLLENILAHVGLESLVVYLRAQKLGEVRVQPSHGTRPDDFPLMSEGIDYD